MLFFISHFSFLISHLIDGIRLAKLYVAIVYRLTMRERRTA